VDWYLIVTVVLSSAVALITLDSIRPPTPPRASVIRGRCGGILHLDNTGPVARIRCPGCGYTTGMDGA
jgi:hypothetical protein